MRFAPGQTVLRRYFRNGRISFLNVCRVLADDERGLRLWLPIGTPFWRLLTPDGRDGHTASVDEMTEASLGELTWRDSHVMVYMPPGGVAHSVWWFFTPEGEFEGWYGNLEAPYTRWADEAGDFPFDGTWTDLRPDPSWPPLVRPSTWDSFREPAPGLDQQAANFRAV
jgi:hypothetical protein